jgi:hypothetical protein
MNKCYLINYDLDKPGQDYQKIIEAMKKLNAVRVEYSSWICWNTASAYDIAKWLLDTKAIDGNDRLVVSQINSNTAWYNLMITKDSMEKIIPAA